MAKQAVVGPDLMLDWDKYCNIMHELHGQIGRGVLTLDHLQAVVEHRNPFEVVASPKAGVVQVVRSVDEILAEWVSFYREVFGEEVDFSGLRVPERRDGFNRLIVVAKGMTPESVFQKCRALFKAWKYTIDRSLDEVVFDADDGVEQKYRQSDHKTYAVWVRDRVEADQELKNLSANQLKEYGILGITLEARELYELKYFKETGKHLDWKIVTLCAGSRRVDGRVPGVDWGGRGRMRVYWYNPSNAYDDLRSREQVS